MAIKALKQTISIGEVQKMIHQWKKRGLNDPTITKLIDLYLGMPAYMDAKGMYPLCNFYDIRLSLRFSYTTTFIAAVEKSQSFGLVWDDTHAKIIAFYSPLWYQKKKQETHPEAAQGTPQNPEPETPQNPEPETPQDSEQKIPQDSEQKTPQDSEQKTPQDPAFDNNIIYNINNIYPPEDSRKGNHGPKGKRHTDANNAPDKAENTATATGFFHRLNTTPDEKRQVLVPIIDNIAARHNYTRPRALQATVVLVNRFLVPYFDANPRFATSTHAGKIVWLRNLLNSAHGQSLMTQAVRQLDAELGKELEEKRKQRRAFRPLSPAEWQDPATGTRYYDDPIDGKVEIPSDAPPRPADTAIWNVLSREWIDTAG